MKCDKCGYCLACEGLEECPNCGPSAESRDEERRQSDRDEQVKAIINEIYGDE